jgi:hypothetical protein
VVAVVAEGQQLADRGWRPHDITGVIDRGMEWLQYTAARLLSGAPRPMTIRDAIRAAVPRPVLIIAGGATADETVAARWFQAASPATVQLWVVPQCRAHPRPGHRAPGLGSPRDPLPERGAQAQSLILASHFPAGQEIAGRVRGGPCCAGVSPAKMRTPRR